MHSMVIINKQLPLQQQRRLIMAMEHHQHLILVRQQTDHLHTVFHLPEISSTQLQHPIAPYRILRNNNNNEEQRMKPVPVRIR